MLESCVRPDLVTEITLQPVRRHGVDAAILFSDIVLPLKAVGVDLDIVPGVGPVVAQPIRTRADLDPLRALEPDDVALRRRGRAAARRRARADAADRLRRRAVHAGVSYLVEGGPSRSHERTKALMYGDPELWHDLLDRLARIAGAFLRVQVEAGRVGRAAVRLVGRRAAARPTTAATSCRTPPTVLDAVGRPGRAADPLRGRHRRAARR